MIKYTPSVRPPSCGSMRPGPKPSACATEIGIRINSADLIAGFIGANLTMSFSLIGSTVNLASGLCSAAKGGQILITENMSNQLGDDLSI